MADYMLVEGALDMLVTVIQDFKTTMETQSVIVSQLSFADQGMNFNANEEECRQVRRWGAGKRGAAACEGAMPSR